MADSPPPTPPPVARRWHKGFEGGSPAACGVRWFGPVKRIDSKWREKDRHLCVTPDGLYVLNNDAEVTRFLPHSCVSHLLRMGDRPEHIALKCGSGEHDMLLRAASEPDHSAILGVLQHNHPEGLPARELDWASGEQMQEALSLAKGPNWVNRVRKVPTFSGFDLPASVQLLAEGPGSGTPPPQPLAALPPAGRGAALEFAPAVEPGTPPPAAASGRHVRLLEVAPAVELDPDPDPDPEPEAEAGLEAEAERKGRVVTFESRKLSPMRRPSARSWRASAPTPPPAPAPPAAAALTPPGVSSPPSIPVPPRGLQPAGALSPPGPPPKRAPRGGGRGARVPPPVKRFADPYDRAVAVLSPPLQPRREGSAPRASWQEQALLQLAQRAGEVARSRRALGPARQHGPSARSAEAELLRLRGLIAHLARDHWEGAEELRLLREENTELRRSLRRHAADPLQDGPALAEPLRRPPALGRGRARAARQSVVLV